MSRHEEDAPALVLIDLAGQATRKARELAVADGAITPDEADWLALMDLVTKQAELVNECELNAISELRRARLSARRLRRMREIGLTEPDEDEAA